MSASSSDLPPSSSSPGAERWAPIAIAAVFLVVGLVGVVHHEMWRDEIEIWLDATGSPTLSDLIANIRTQPHPWLWYVLTWLLSRATADWRAMQLLSLAIGTATAYLFSRRAPLPLAQRALFCFGYFPLYEYTLISRSYGLDLFFAILFCVLYARDERRYPWLALTIALLANVHLLGTVIAGLLLLLLAWDAVALQRRDAAGPRVWASLLVAAGGIAFGLAVGLFAAGRMGAEHVRRAPIDLAWLESTLSSIVGAFLPIPDVFVRSFWNSSFLALLPDRLAAPVTIGLAIALYALSVAALRRSGLPLALYLAGTAAMLAVFAEKSSGYQRHYGHLAILFIALLWLAATRDGRSRALTGAAAAAFAVALALHVASAAFVYGGDLVYPFSRSLDASRFLAGREELAGATLVGSIDYTAQPFAAYLGKSIYYPDQRRFGTFMTWGPEREVVRYQQVLRDAARLLRETEKPVVLILNYDPKIGAAGDRCRVDDELELELLAAFPCAIVSEESYWLTALRPAAADGSPAAVKRCVPRGDSIGPHVEIPRLQTAEAESQQERARLERRAARAAAEKAAAHSSWRIAACGAEPSS